ncbi:hypothetical protein SPSIL_017230 [Sporomusa silvacetica DSM 10669]|uniref:Uncharacterized protein n=1 Tax=Sporomusa silvacetica DSM 10669 TaxID=1123289 RepID=A0ABZ3IJL4_9FIRM|nr:hypothetical protein [Sporomusa silvacetica]OZC18376.1 hypothetical protein SPSIL_25760 [Sporomusa silvacetica DSM 10669]
MGFISALSVPIMFLNMFGGIVAGIWLIIISKWAPVGLAIIFLILTTFAASFVLIPAMLLVVPGFNMIKKGTGVFGHFLIFCANVYTFGLFWYWSISVFRLYVSYIEPHGTGAIPLLLMAYSVATGPISYMASKDGGDSPATAIAALSTMLGCALFMLLLIFGINPWTANLVFMVVLAVGLFIQLVMSVQFATATRISEEQEYFRQ